MNEKRYEIKQIEVEGLIKYLQQRPYAEVYQGIDMLLKLKPIIEEEESSKKEKE